MADGSTQKGFGFRELPSSRLRPGEIVVDLFAGGGGASVALEQALGRPVDVAINHDDLAIRMHAVNHPLTRHLPEDIWHTDPQRLVAGRQVGWLHLSPDCTDHSQAKGGQPRNVTTRALSWVAIKWAGRLARAGLGPRIISLENVRQIAGWGPLVAKRCPATGRVMRVDRTVAAPGERVPRHQQWLVPDPRRRGRTWQQFLAALRGLGYVVEHRILNALHYGAATDRHRLFLVARNDGEPIRWPAPTHGLAAHQRPPGCAADSIDWSVLGTSIFDRPRPLRPNTIRRLLDGARRANWPQPYLDALAALRDGRRPVLDITIEQAEAIAQRFGHPSGLVMATGSGGVARGTDQPIPTITAGGNGAAPHFIRPVIVYRQNSEGGRQARTVDEALPTIATRGAGHLGQPALVPLTMGTPGTARAKPVSEPLPTITTGGAANRGRPGCARPQVVEPILAPYYGNGSGLTGKGVGQAMPTVTTKHRFGLAVPVVVSTCNSNSSGVRLATDPVRTITTARGGDQAMAEPVVVGYRIDVLYRMLFERELFNAMGFPPDYVIDRTADGRRLTRTQAVRMVGNSVSPPPLYALAEANLDTADQPQAVAA